MRERGEPSAQSQQFAELFRSIYHRFHRRDRVDAYQPTRESLAILRHLYDIGPLTVMEAARHFERSQSAMSELINRLEQRGLLSRMTDERDRRRTLVWLTPLGQDTLEKSEQVLSLRLLGHAFDQLPEPEISGILEALDKLLATERMEPGTKDD